MGMSNFFSTGSFNLYTGDNSSFDLQILDDNGNPVNLTGYELYFSVKRNPILPDSQATIYLTQTTHSNAVNGQSSFPITPTETGGAIPGKYFFDVKSKDTSGNITTLYNDTLFIISSITTIVTGR